MITAQEIVKIVGGELHGDGDLTIKGVASLIPGEGSSVSFVKSDIISFDLKNTNSDLIIVSKDFKSSFLSKTVIVTNNPKRSFFKIVKELFYSDDFCANYAISDSAIISSKAKIDQNVHIGPNVFIEDNVKISSGARIGANCFIGLNSIIGKDSTLYPNVTIYKDVLVGDNVKINSGSIIGAHGFGVLNDNGLTQVPHIGKVIIENNVVLGAGCTIDRATISETVVGEGTKLDGQVHIAHNVKIGKNCVISGQVAIGGSTTIGNNVVLGGQVGIIDNLNIGDDCKVAAKSAVMKSLDAGQIVSGIPAIEHSKKRRLDVLYYKLPDLFKKVKKL